MEHPWRKQEGITRSGIDHPLRQFRQYARCMGVPHGWPRLDLGEYALQFGRGKVGSKLETVPTMDKIPSFVTTKDNVGREIKMGVHFRFPSSGSGDQNTHSFGKRVWYVELSLKLRLVHKNLEVIDMRG
jgi:hypothetical protein